MQCTYSYITIEVHGIKSAHQSWRKALLTMIEHIPTYTRKNGLVMDIFVGTLSLACAATKMGRSAIVNENHEVRFRADLDCLILFSKPLIQRAINCKAVMNSTRPLDSSSDIWSPLGFEGDQHATCSLFTNDGSALYEITRSFEKHVTKIKAKCFCLRYLNEMLI